MSWLSGFVFKNILGQESNPNKVLDVKPDQYSDRPIHCREDALVLYGPKREKSSERYEVILHRPCTETLHQAFSLFRSKELHDAEIKFIQVKDKVPLLAGISREVCNLNGIQKLCDTLEENPSWTIAHLVSHFALQDTLQHPAIVSHLNSSCAHTGISPLQVAIKTSNLRTVQSLLMAKASLEHLDYEANSVYHYAASTTKEIISALSGVSTKCLNNRNSNGCTPLHMACLADNPECVKALLIAGADVNIPAAQASVPSSSVVTPPGYVGDFLHDNSNKLHTEDMKFGGTPLHWSCSKVMIETLVDMGCDINALNFGRRTALHIMVLRNRLECVVALLSRGADVSIGDSDGNTPLHMAVTERSLPVVQAIIVFGADLTYKNNSGATPRHGIGSESGSDKILNALHAVGAPRCTEDMVGCTPGCISSRNDYNGALLPVPPASESREVLDQMLSVAGMDVAASSALVKQKKMKGGRVLCLDGGGIRGLVLVVILLELEKAVGHPLIHCFDWIAGTSTGGILTLGLASGKTLKECLCLYFRMKEHAFVGSRPYSSEPLETILKEALGTDTVMADIKQPKIIITGVLADRKPVDLHMFRNYTSPSRLLNVEQRGLFAAPPNPEDQLLWRAARATGAAPSYFRAFGRFLDGGLIANNPTLDVLTEIHEYNLALKACGRTSEVCPATVVVSLGTGLVPLTQLKGIDVFRPESVWDTARLAIGISALGTLLVDQATASDGRVVDRARAWCSMIGVPYFRFTPQMSEDIAMDEKNDQKLVNMLWEAKSYVHSNYSMVREVAELLNMK